MFEEIETAEKNDVRTSAVDSNADVNQERTEINEEEFVDSQENEAADKSPSTDEEDSTKQVNSENAHRRRAEQREKELKTARVEATIEALRGKNPYTGEPMKDATDVEEYFTMRKIEDEGGDPVADFAKYHKAEARKQAEAAEKQAEKSEWIKTDAATFRAKYPNVKFEDLSKNKAFMSYADGKIGVTPLVDIYEGYKAITDEAEAKAKNAARQALANAKATPGALRTATSSEKGFFSKQQVDAMSKEEVRANYDDIVKSQKKW